MHQFWSAQQEATIRIDLWNEKLSGTHNRAPQEVQNPAKREFLEIIEINYQRRARFQAEDQFISVMLWALQAKHFRTLIPNLQLSKNPQAPFHLKILSKNNKRWSCWNHSWCHKKFPTYKEKFIESFWLLEKSSWRTFSWKVVSRAVFVSCLIHIDLNSIKISSADPERTGKWPLVVTYINEITHGLQVIYWYTK